MEIACPQCSMKYALDPRLLPPGGVPVQCTRCSHVFIAGATPAEPTPAPKAAKGSVRAPNPLNTTLAYGGSAKAPSAPLTTQAFGAVPQVPPVSPVAPRVAPAPTPAPAPAPAKPATQRTQAFGAVPQIPPAAKPAAPVAPAAKPAAPIAKPAAPPSSPPVAEAVPNPRTTQVFGAIPVPGVSSVPQPVVTAPVEESLPLGHPGVAAPRAARPASGAPPSPEAGQRVPSRPPVPTYTMLPAVSYGDPLAPAPAPPTASPPASSPAPAPAPAPTAQPPGMVPRQGASERPAPGAPAPGAPRPPGIEPRVGVAATTPIELPEEILSQLDRPLSELMGGEEAGPSAPSPMGVAASGKPLELPPELGNSPVLTSREPGSDTRAPHKGHTGRNLLIAASVLVVALTAFLTSRAWMPRGDRLPHEAQAARDTALAQLRRDDAGSRQDAITQLRALVASYPKSVELLAEEGIALALQLDDLQVSITTLQDQEQNLSKRIELLTSTQTPIDWQSRANTRQEERTALLQRLSVLKDRAQGLSLESVGVLKRLESGATPEEPPEAALARLRARAVMNGTLGANVTPDLAVKLAQARQADWSALAMAEYVLHLATPTPEQTRDAAAAMERLRTDNTTFLRAYMLGARLGLLRQEPAAAQGLLDTVITLNPKHELAQQLHAYIQELANRAAEPPPPVKAPPAPAPLPEPAPESPDAGVSGASDGGASGSPAAVPVPTPAPSLGRDGGTADAGRG